MIEDIIINLIIFVTYITWVYCCIFKDMWSTWMYSYSPYDEWIRFVAYKIMDRNLQGKFPWSFLSSFGKKHLIHMMVTLTPSQWHYYLTAENQHPKPCVSFKRISVLNSDKPSQNSCEYLRDPELVVKYVASTNTSRYIYGFECLGERIVSSQCSRRSSNRHT